jgi:hypothetical protein
MNDKCVICGKVEHKRPEKIKVKGGYAYLDCIRS